jgi:hypothetical protein
LALWGLTLYAMTYALQGGGSLFELLSSMQSWDTKLSENFWERIYFSTSYAPLVRFAHSDFPLLQYIDSELLDHLSWLLPALMWMGLAGSVLVYVVLLLGRVQIDYRHLVAMTLTLLFTLSEFGGGYALVFTLYLVFFEPWQGWVRGIMLGCAYLLCIPADYLLLPIFQQTVDSYWGNRAVYSEFGLAAGHFIRPFLVLVILYCQIILNLGVSSSTRRNKKRNDQYNANPIGPSTTSQTTRCLGCW